MQSPGVVELRHPDRKWREKAPSPLPGPEASTIAMVHDWCPKYRGGERVLSAFCQIFGQRDIFTLFDFLPEEVKERHFPGVRFHTSAANRLPFIEKFYRHLFFLCPLLIEQFDVTEFDGVISSSAAFSRGVLTRPDQPHLCYVHSPARYAWDEQFSYLGQAGLGYGPKGLLVRSMLHKLRMWDVRTAHGPDLMVANSSYIRHRIRKIYGRDADVVFPPVEVDELKPSSVRDDFYVTASFLAPYKRTDLVVEAFNAMPNRRLVVVGEGPQLAKLRNMAGPNVEVKGYLPRGEYVSMVSTAKAFVFAGCEDFGIAIAEAQAAGTPVIALARGGACDIVEPLGASDLPTGVLFERQTADAIKAAVERFETARGDISSDACRQNSLRFAPDRFAREMRKAWDRTVAVNRAAGGRRV